jgi:steroid delta-isomerase-like uncharacterized protein
MSVKENKELLKRYFAAADADAFRKSAATGKDDFHSPDLRVHSLQRGDMNLIQYMQFMSSLSDAFPDTKYTVDDMIAEGDKVVVRYNLTGTHKGVFQGIPPTGKQMTVKGVNVYRVEGGRLAEAWNFVDFLGMMQQLGVIPKR